MPEEITIGGLVTDVTANDPDVGDNARLVFDVDGSPDAAFFYFDSIFATQSGAPKMATVRTAILLLGRTLLYCDLIIILHCQLNG